MHLGFTLRERWLKCWSLGVLIIICVFIRQTESSGAISDIEHNMIKASTRSGPNLLKLCPAGGEAFTTAWQIACGMRKRKRSISTKPVKRGKNEYRSLTLSEMMKFCCKYGCSFRDLLAYCDPFGDWDS